MKAATVSSLSGQVYVERGGQQVTLEQGAELSKSDVVRTEADSKVELQFLDNSIIELGPSTEIAIQDFAFDPSGQAEPAFGLHMMSGVVRSISGRIVEQNPESFKLTSPLGAVGIRGTETLHVIGKASEIHSIINMEAGHTVVISTQDGRSIVLTQALKGVSLTGNSNDPLMERDVTPDWVNDYFQQVSGEGVVSGGEAPRGYYVVADAAFLSSMDVPTSPEGVAFVPENQLDTLVLALEDAGVESEILEEVLSGFEVAAEASDILSNETPVSAQPPLHVAGGTPANRPSPEVPDPGPGPGPGPVDEPQVNADGVISPDLATPNNDQIIAGGAAYTISGLEGNDSITVYGQSSSTVYGEQNEMNSGTGGNDTISIVDHSVLGNGDIVSGNIYGDAQNMNNDSNGGNDSIYVQGHVSGNIYGDAYAMNGNNNGGSDSINVGGTLKTGGNIFGDAEILNSSSNGGNDVISVQNVEGGSIYGDAHTMNTSGSGGADSITVVNFSSGNIYGDAHTINSHVIAGNDTIKVTNFSGGNIYGDADSITSGVAGADNISITNMSGGNVYGDAQTINGSVIAGADNININHMSGGDVYGDAHTIISVTSLGHDTITIGTLNGGNVYGDVYSSNGDKGNDRITVGTMNGGNIYGDAFYSGGGTMGNDTIMVGNMTGGNIYGDSATSDSITAGSNTINVTGTMSGGTIYAGNSYQTAGGTNNLFVNTYAGGEIRMAGDSNLKLGSIDSGSGKSIYCSSGGDTIGIGTLSGDSSININQAGSGDTFYFASEYGDFFSANTAGTTYNAVENGANYQIVLSYGGKSLTLLFEAAVSVTIGTYPVDGGNYNSFTVN